MNQFQRDFCREALQHYGHASQIDKAIEECDELSDALTKYQATSGLQPHHRKRFAVDAIGEIADVLIMAQQMRILFGAELVDEQIAAKIERQRKRMQGGE